MPNSLCVVSEDAISREGLVHIAANEGYRVSGATASVDEINWEASGESALVLLDIPDEASQVAAVRQVAQASPNSKPVVLSNRFEYSNVVDCFRDGAQGYILRSGDWVPLMTSLKLVTMGHKVVPSSLVDALHHVPGGAPGMMPQDPGIDRANLSQRELEVLSCLMAGMSNKVIARELDVTEATVKVHVKAILRKLKVGNRTQAAIWGAGQGLSNASRVMFGSKTPM